MQLDSFPSDSSSSQANDPLCADCPDLSSATSADLACELSSLHSTLQPFLDTLFAHHSTTSNCNSSSNIKGQYHHCPPQHSSSCSCSAATENEPVSTTLIISDRTRVRDIFNSCCCSNNNIDGSATATEPTSVGAPFKSLLSNHSEPLDLPAAGAPASTSTAAAEPLLSEQLFVLLAPKSQTISGPDPCLDVYASIVVLHHTEEGASIEEEPNNVRDHQRQHQQQRDERVLSEPQFHRGSEVDSLESPCLTLHSHITYPNNTTAASITLIAAEPEPEPEPEPAIEVSVVEGQAQEKEAETTEEMASWTACCEDLNHSQGPQASIPVLQLQLQKHHCQQQQQQQQEHEHERDQQALQQARSVVTRVVHTSIHNKHNDNNNKPRSTDSSNISINSSVACALDMSAQLDHASISRIGLHEPVSTLSSGLDHRPTVCSLSAAVIEKNEDELHVSGEDLVNTLGVSSERRKRSTGAGSSDGFSNARKRRSGRFEEHSRTLRPQSSAPSAASAIQHHDERWEQECLNVLHAKLLKQSEDASPKQNKTLDFDLSALVLSWSHPQQQSDHVSSCNASRRRGARRSRSYSGTGKKSANNNHSDVPCPYRRKRIFGEAIELSCPLSAGSQTSDHHPVWIESIKKRKVHQYPTKWTSSLSPAPYVKLMTIRDFWDVMEVQLDNGSLHFAPRNETENNLFTYPSVGVNLRKTTVSTAVSPTMASQVGDKDTTTLAIFKSSRSVTALKRDMHSQTTRQYPCPKPFLKGLWEEELRHQRERQMIPDTIRRPTRSKIFTSKPICQASNVNAKPTLPPLFTTAPTMLSSPSLPVDETPGGIARNQTQQPSQAVFKDFEMSLKKKQRTTAIIRSHGIAEGSDMSKYRPWKDGTILPSTGTLQELKQLRSNIMDPWPVEEAKSKDECTRVLHRMREQLNIVINLQIHLRSMIKTAPTQWSFLLSIRHPAQVSIELLLALYGPHFMQTSNFRAIEQLLWGTGADVKAAQVSQSESQLVADAPTSTEALLQV